VLRAHGDMDLGHVFDQLWKRLSPILGEIKPVHGLGEAQVGVHKAFLFLHPCSPIQRDLALAAQTLHVRLTQHVQHFN
jgi:hypothetical protein